MNDISNNTTERGPNSRKDYLGIRKQYIEIGRASASSFDKTIIALAGGAFAVSLAFLKDIAPSPTKAIWLLGIGWGGFILSIITNLSSYLTSMAVSKKWIELLDIQQYKEGDLGRNPYERWTTRLNLASVVFFILGMVFLSMFAIANL